MPALNFKSQFEIPVKLGIMQHNAQLHPDRIDIDKISFAAFWEKNGSVVPKRQTIRAFRKDNKNPSAGDVLYLYTGMRTKQCKKLGEVTCKNTTEVTIEKHGLQFPLLSADEAPNMTLDQFAKMDGFSNWQEMAEWFDKTHGLPFTGLLISW